MSKKFKNKVNSLRPSDAYMKYIMKYAIIDSDNGLAPIHYVKQD